MEHRDPADVVQVRLQVGQVAAPPDRPVQRQLPYRVAIAQQTINKKLPTLSPSDFPD
jgi:hypothetical protein